MYPASLAYEALLIVCLFGVVLGGLNLTAVYKPSFYGFALTALLPLIARVAIEADTVHLYTAIVMSVVLAFILAFGHHLNDVLTHSLAIRYENVDLIAELKAQTGAALEARSAAETANRAKSQLLAAASHDLRQPLHALGLFAAALDAKARDPDLKRLVASMQTSVDALEGLFAQLPRLVTTRSRRALAGAGRWCRCNRCSHASPPTSRRRRLRTVSACASCRPR
jgi:signal transduction histidine kinase